MESNKKIIKSHARLLLPCLLLFCIQICANTVAHGFHANNGKNMVSSIPLSATFNREQFPDTAQDNGQEASVTIQPDKPIGPDDPFKPEGPFVPTNPTIPDFQERNNLGYSVGNFKGTLSVSKLGAAVYNLDFEVPYGGSLTPKIGLSYNSHSSGYGIAG